MKFHPFYIKWMGDFRIKNSASAKKKYSNYLNEVIINCFIFYFLYYFNLFEFLN